MDDRRYLELRLRRPASVWPLAARCSASRAALALVITLLLVRPDDRPVRLLGPRGPAAAARLPRGSRPVAQRVPDGGHQPGAARARPDPRAAAARLAGAARLRHRRDRLPGRRREPAGSVPGGRRARAPRCSAAVLGAALLGGLVFRGKSGFCGSVCPLRPVQGLYSQAALVKVENSHCQPCVGCTTNCTDLKPDTALRDDLRDEERPCGPLPEAASPARFPAS